MKVVNSKTNDSIKKEWDAIAAKRYEQIISNKDISYNYVLLPTILKLIENCDLSMVIDVGCGVGFTTKKVASKAKSLLAIDLSNKCIEIAQSNCKKYKNVDFKNISIEKYAKDTTSPRFTLAIANMTLMTSLNLDSFIKSIHKILVPGGKFVATITHPCFWPIYRGYSTADWFDYTKEIIIEAPFWITNEHTKYKTTHVHRPLEMYYSAFKKNLFIVESFCEPMPDNEILKKYSQIWLSPHFAAFRCISK